MKKRLAIVGSGMAGMASAYFLKDDYEISLFEKNDYIGGHTNTVYVKEEGKELPIDTGFMVFNEHTYPLMCKLFKKLSVNYHDTSMSFCVYDANRNFEYNGGSFGDLFTQKKNALSPRFWKMLIDIVKFGKGVPKYLSDASFDGISLGELIKRENLGEGFTHDYLLPMTAAVWSTPHDEMLRFPARSMVRFLQNHGLTGIDTQHQWKTVERGSQTYKLKLIESFKDKIQINKEVTAVTQKESSVLIEFKDTSSETFDMVIMASHADETKRLLINPTSLQKEILSPFEYQKNEAWLHTDSSVMPKIRKNWSSWNQVLREDERFTIYYMNMLQPISKKIDYFININGTQFVDKSKVIKKITYHHPVFSTQTEAAQKRIPELNNGKTPIYFCGAWQRYGFHEDALMSSVQLCESILGRSVL